MEQFHEETDPVRTGVMASELLAFAIGAHHGLFDCVDHTRRIGLKYRAEKQGISYEESVQGLFSQGISKQEIERLFSSAVGEIDPILEQLEREYVDDHEYFFVVGLLARLQPPILQSKTSITKKPRKPQRFAGFLYPLSLSQYLPFSPV